MQSQPPFVIVISGPSGAGKSTMVKEVAAQLGEASMLSYDDYFHLVPHPDILAWIEQGCDPDQWIALPQLVADVRALREGQAIGAPEGRIVMSSRYIVLEEPWRTRSRGTAALDRLRGPHRHTSRHLPLPQALARLFPPLTAR